MRRKGFTLVELLVVVAIVILLVGLIVPSLSAVRNRTRRMMCASNLRGIAQAALEYSAAHDGYVLRDYNHTGGSHTFWAGHYAEFLGQSIGDFQYRPLFLETPDPRPEPKYYKALAAVEIYRCPSVPNTDAVLHYVNNGVDFLEYQRRSQEGRPESECYTWSGPSRLSHLPGAPSEVLQLAEADLEALPANQFDYHDLERPSHMTFDPDGQPNQAAQWPHNSLRMVSSRQTRHYGYTTIAFYDGHADQRLLQAGQLPTRLLNPLAGK